MIYKYLTFYLQKKRKNEKNKNIHFFTIFHNKNKKSKKVAKFYKKRFGNFFGIGHFCFF